jgi:predicted nucleic-acid-binding Zn-ribbon protein
MWTCGNCREVLEDQFDSCWNCGCSREGKLNLEFMQEPSSVGDDSSLEKKFSQYHVCQKCQHRDARVERISSRGTGFARLMQKDFLAVSCQYCGYTELFHLSVLEGRSDLGNFLRGLFGG